jgi:hypothetical protein
MRRFLAYHMTAPREPTPPSRNLRIHRLEAIPNRPLSLFLCPLQPDIVGGGEGREREELRVIGTSRASRGRIRSLRKRPRRVAPLVAPRLVATRSSRGSPKSCIYFTLPVLLLDVYASFRSKSETIKKKKDVSDVIALSLARFSISFFLFKLGEAFNSPIQTVLLRVFRATPRQTPDAAECLGNLPGRSVILYVLYLYS